MATHHSIKLDTETETQILKLFLCYIVEKKKRRNQNFSKQEGNKNAVALWRRKSFLGFTVGFSKVSKQTVSDNIHGRHRRIFPAEDKKKQKNEELNQNPPLKTWICFGSSSHQIEISILGLVPKIQLL